MSDLTPLSQVTTSIQYGYTASSSPTANGPKLLRITDIQKGAVDWGSVPRCLIDNNMRSRFLLKDGDILFARSGATVGKSFLICGDNHDVVFASYLIRVRFDQAKVDPRYAYLFFASKDYWDQVNEGVSGTGQPNFNGTKLAALRIPVPPLAEQRRIVARIEALFARTRRARTDLERIAPLARRHRDRTLVNAFDAGTPRPIHDLALSIFDGPFGSNLKSDDYTKAGTRVVRLENIGHLRFIGEKETFISDVKAEGLCRHLLKPHDVLFSSFIDEEVRVCLLPEDLPTRAINKADCFCVRLDTARADPRYVVLRLASPTTYEDMRDAVHGATRPRIGITDLKRYTINVPPIAEQQITAACVEQQHTMSRLIESEASRALTLLDRFEQSILARAFRGELADVVMGDLSKQHTNDTELTASTPAKRAKPSKANVIRPAHQAPTRSTVHVE